MRKIKRWKQGIAVAGVIALTGSLLAGCGGADGKNSGSKGETGSSNQAGNADTADLVNVNTDNSDGKKTKDESAKAMGRFLENDLTVPENSQFLRDVKVLDSGALRMVYYSTADNCYYAADSADNGETWTNGKSLEELLGLKENLGEYISVVSVAADGSIFVGADLSPDRDNENAQTTADSGEEDSAYDNLKMEFFYLSPDGNVQKVDTGDTIQSSYTFQACFTENGTVLIVDPGNGVAEINPSDGSLVRRYEEGIRVDFIGTAGKMLFTIQDQTLHGYDLDTGKPLDNISALTEQIQSDEQDVNWTTTSSFPLMFLKGDEDNSLFYIDHTGVYRYVLGGSTVEQIIDGSLNSLSSPDLFMRHRARRMEHRIARAVSAGGISGGVAGAVAGSAVAGKRAERKNTASKENRGNTTSSMGQRAGSKVGAVLDTKNKVKDKANAVKENIKDMPTQTAYAVYSAKEKAKSSVSDFKRGMVQEQQSRQTGRLEKQEQHRQNIADKRMELQKAQEARQAQRKADGSATTGATRPHERPATASSVSKTGAEKMQEVKRPATATTSKISEPVKASVIKERPLSSGASDRKATQPTQPVHRQNVEKVVSQETRQNYTKDRRTKVQQTQSVQKNQQTIEKTRNLVTKKGQKKK